MVIITESARTLKGFIAASRLQSLAAAMVLRMVLALIGHRGRMTCSAAAGSVASESIHRGQLTRFLARPRWQKIDFHAPLRRALFDHEARRAEGKSGRYIFLIDATLVSQAGTKTQNTHRCVRQESWHPKPAGNTHPKLAIPARDTSNATDRRSENAEGAEAAEFGRNA